MRAALVTGSNAGIGRATALALAAAGFRVFASCRRPAQAEDLRAEALARGLSLELLELDVADAGSIERAVATVEQQAGPIAVLINNAGFGVMGALEDVPAEAIRDIFATNVFGALALIRRVLPGMRAAGWGRIVNVSSLAGAVSFPGTGLYSATKFALEALSDALRIEVGAHGVEVIVVQPGPVATRFEQRAFGPSEVHLARPHSPYLPLYAAMRAANARMKRFAAPPEAVARVIVRAVRSPRPRARYRVTLPATLLPLLRRLIPDRVWTWAQIRMLRPGR